MFFFITIHLNLSKAPSIAPKVYLSRHSMFSSEFSDCSLNMTKLVYYCACYLDVMPFYKMILLTTQTKSMVPIPIHIREQHIFGVAVLSPTVTCLPKLRPLPCICCFPRSPRDNRSLCHPKTHESYISDLWPKYHTKIVAEVNKWNQPDFSNFSNLSHYSRWTSKGSRTLSHTGCILTVTVTKLRGNP